MTTCVPLQFDDEIWRTAVFFELGGKECERDRHALESVSSPVAIGLEADLIEEKTAAVVMLRFEIMTIVDNPLAGEVLITPGLGNIQFETLNTLSGQDYLPFYFADGNYNVIHSQQLGLGNAERGGYRSLLDDAVSHDALIRLSGKYDAVAALKEVTSHYAAHISN